MQFVNLKSYHLRLYYFLSKEREEVNKMEFEEKNKKEFSKQDEQNKLAYKYILQVRDLDSKLFWTRVNTFLFVQGVLLAFLGRGFLLLIDKNKFVILIIVLFGLACSIFQWGVVKKKGGAFWINFWEHKLAEIEKNVLGEINVFRKYPTTNEKVRKKIKNNGYISTRRIYETLSAIFIVLWIGL